MLIMIESANQAEIASGFQECYYTQRAYLAAVTDMARFYNQSPDKMTQERAEDYLLYLKLDRGIAPNSG